MTKEVTVEPEDGPINEAIDQAYRDSPYLASMISDRARTATIQIFPRTET